MWPVFSICFQHVSLFRRYSKVVESPSLHILTGDDDLDNLESGRTTLITHMTHIMFNCQHLWGDNSRKRVVQGCKQNDAHQASTSNYVIDDVYCYAMSSCSCRYKEIAFASIHTNRFHWDYLTAAKLSISPHWLFLVLKFQAPRSGRACLSLRCLRSWSQCPQAVRGPTRSISWLRSAQEWHRKRRRLGTPLELGPEVFFRAFPGPSNQSKDWWLHFAGQHRHGRWWIMGCLQVIYHDLPNKKWWFSIAMLD